MSLIKFLLTIVFLPLFPLLAETTNVIVTDGDTIRIGEERIRFSGIDAPEINQTCTYQELEFACGEFSKNLLVEKIQNQQVNCVREGKDQYGRTLAECFVNQESLSSFLVREGYAFAYRKYSKKFVLDEEYAQNKSKGMWATEFQYPWDYRRNN